MNQVRNPSHKKNKKYSKSHQLTLMIARRRRKRKRKRVVIFIKRPRRQLSRTRMINKLRNML